MDHDHSPHDKHAGHPPADFLKKFWVTLVLTLPILAYSEIFEIAFGATLPLFAGYQWVILALGSVIFFYCGWVFLLSAYRELRGRMPGMMTLIALAIVTAYAWSVYATFVGEHTLFWELSTLIAIMLLGHWIEMRAVQGAKGALKELSALLPDEAKHLKSGDVVVVKPGAKVPGDGEVQSGISEVDESILTGESRPVSKRAGDSVIAGSINGDGSLTVRVTKTGEATFLAGVMRLVAEAEASKSKLQLLADRAALWLTLVAIGVGASTFVVWLSVGAGVVFSVERLVAVFVIACPPALGLAIPLVASISTTMAAKNGFLVKQRRALEAARTIDTVLFDKTGTLNKGAFSVTQVSSDEALALAAAVDAHSEHPIAKAIVDEAK